MLQMSKSCGTCRRKGVECSGILRPRKGNQGKEQFACEECAKHKIKCLGMDEIVTGSADASGSSNVSQEATAFGPTPMLQGHYSSGPTSALGASEITSTVFTNSGQNSNWVPPSGIEIDAGTLWGSTPAGPSGSLDALFVSLGTIDTSHQLSFDMSLFLPVPPPIFEIPAEYFYVHQFYEFRGIMWNFDDPNTPLPAESYQVPDPLYLYNAYDEIRYFCWLPADSDGLALPAQIPPPALPVAAYHMRDAGYTSNFCPQITQTANPKANGPMGDHVLAVRWVQWFEIHADIRLPRGTYDVEFLFKTIPMTDILIKPNMHNGTTIVDNWDLPRQPISDLEARRSVDGIILVAGFPETYQTFLPNFEDTLAPGKVGKMRDRFGQIVGGRPRRGVDGREDPVGAWKAWELNGGGPLVVPEDGAHVRLLACQGSNSRNGGAENPSRGRFLFGGARLTKKG